MRILLTGQSETCNFVSKLACLTEKFIEPSKSEEKPAEPKPKEEEKKAAKDSGTDEL